MEIVDAVANSNSHLGPLCSCFWTLVEGGTESSEVCVCVDACVCDRLIS